MLLTYLTLVVTVSSTTLGSDIIIDEFHGRFRARAEEPDLLPRANISSNNLQTFTGALGGVRADPIFKQFDKGQRPFFVQGDSFPDFETAAGRSCDNQQNKCAAVVNSGQAFGVQIPDCDVQNKKCHAAISNMAAAAVTAAPPAEEMPVETVPVAPPADTASTSSSSLLSLSTLSSTPSLVLSSVLTTPTPPPGFASPVSISKTTTPEPLVVVTPPPAPLASTTSSAQLELVSQSPEFNFFCEV